MKTCKRDGCSNTVNDPRNNFCSKSCSAKVNNIGVRRHGNGPQKTCCEFCGKVFYFRKRNSLGLYCSSECFGKHKSKLKKEEWYKGELKKLDRSVIRKYLKEDRGNRCEIEGCGLSMWLGKDIVLIVDHINGNPGDDRPENVRLICPNCNSQTDTFSGRNKGMGRKSRGLPR